MTFDGKRRTNRDYGDSPARRSRVPIASSRLASPTRGTVSRLPFGSAVESWPPQPSACPRPSLHAVPRVGDASPAAASVRIARRRAEKERAEAFLLCERRRHRRIPDVRAADLQEEMMEQRSSVPSSPTKTVATQRTSQRAERAIKHSAMREQPRSTVVRLSGHALCEEKAQSSA